MPDNLDELRAAAASVTDAAINWDQWLQQIEAGEQPGLSFYHAVGMCILTGGDMPLPVREYAAALIVGIATHGGDMFLPKTSKPRTDRQQLEIAMRVYARVHSASAPATVISAVQSVAEEYFKGPDVCKRYYNDWKWLVAELDKTHNVEELTGEQAAYLHGQLR